MEKICGYCIHFEATMGREGECSAGKSDLELVGKPALRVPVLVSGDARRCEDFEMTLEGVRVAENEASGPDNPDLPFHGTLHAGPDVPTVGVGVAR